MRTTVELPDSLLREAHRQAREEGTTLRALIESGLRTVLEERTHRDQFVLPDASVGGNGLQVPGASWDEIRAVAYGDSQ